VGRILALAVGTVVSALCTAVAVRVFPVFVGVPLPPGGRALTATDLSTLALVVGPTPGAFLAGYLSDDGPRIGAVLGLAVAALPIGFAYFTLALLLMALGIYGGVVGGSLLDGLGVALLVLFFALLFLVALLVSQTGAALAGAAGSYVRRHRDREEGEAVSEP